MDKIIALIAGTIFGAGLAISGMTDRMVVLGFLDIFGAWNPALLFVMGAAVLLTIPAFYFIVRRPKPMFADSFSLPDKRNIDGRLLLGAGLFGLGWGLYGLCPGPAIASLVYLYPDTIMFCVAMGIGMFLQNQLKQK